jgi:alcohol dehydrogenase (cytochrome c)
MRLRTGLLAASILVAAAAGSAAQTSSDLLAHNPADWPTYAGDYTGQRHSALTQITPANARMLAAAWTYHMLGQSQLEAVPIVSNGIMYISQFNRVDAIDARTGKLVWQYQHQPISTQAQRGTGIFGNKVFVTTADGHLVALDARTGAVLWDTKTQWQLAGQAPLVARGKVIVSGNRPNGFIQAYDLETGKLDWTWTPIPDASDPKALATWGGQKPEGAPIWVSGTFDPEQNLLIMGTGQPEPQWAGEGRPGDNLYSDCIVALDIMTGKLKWYFQNTPHDTHDYDSLEVPVLVDAVYKGRPRKLVLQANRNGYYYIIDRTNGKFLFGTPFVSKIDWSSGLTADGKPIPVPGHDPTVLGTTTCPSTAGATNWPSPTYDPKLHIFYVVVAEGCGINLRDTSKNYAGTGYMESPAPGKEWQLYTRALDAFTGKKLWDYEQVSSHHYGPGLVSDAAGVVFSGEEFGDFTALDGRSGKPLWHYNTGDVITASPISYSIDGKQYVAIASGSNIFSFALPDWALAAAKTGGAP